VFFLLYVSLVHPKLARAALVGLWCGDALGLVLGNSNLLWHGMLLVRGCALPRRIDKIPGISNDGRRLLRGLGVPHKHPVRLGRFFLGENAAWPSKGKLARAALVGLCEGMRAAAVHRQNPRDFKRWAAKGLIFQDLPFKCQGY